MIVTELAGWVGEGSTGRRYAAGLALVRLAALTPDSSRPDLVELVDSDELRAHLVVLWRAALGLKVVDRQSGETRLAAPQSWALLAEWVRQFEERPGMPAFLHGVLAGDAADAQELKATFRLHLRLWMHRRLVEPSIFNLLNRLPFR